MLSETRWARHHVQSPVTVYAACIIVTLACLMNLRFNAVPQELSRRRRYESRAQDYGQKAAATRKRNTAKHRAAAEKAALTRRRRAAGKKAAVTRNHRAAGRKAAATRTRRASARKAAATRASKKEEAAPTQPVQVQEPPAPEPQVQATPETSIPE
jgi:hypothetical protein